MLKISLIINSGKRLKVFTLVENNQVVTEDEEVANSFVEYFDSIVPSLGLQVPTELITPTDNPYPIQIAIDDYQNHPNV